MANNFVDYRKVQRIELEGRSFRSKAEVQMYMYLKALLQKGEIQNIRHEQRISLVPGRRDEKIDYYVDFVVFDCFHKEDVYIEVKGFETANWKLKLRLWRHFGPGLLRVYKVGWNRMDLQEEVVPRRSLIIKQEGDSK